MGPLQFQPVNFSLGRLFLEEGLQSLVLGLFGPGMGCWDPGLSPTWGVWAAVSPSWSAQVLDSGRRLHRVSLLLRCVGARTLYLSLSSVAPELHVPGQVLSLSKPPFLQL